MAAIALFVLLYFLSFHPLNWFWVGWLALTLLLCSLRGLGWKERLWRGWVAGVLVHAALNYWIPVTIFNARELFSWSGGIALFLAVLAWVLTACVLGVYVAVWAVWAGAHLPGRELFWCLAVAAGWTALEFARSLGALGYPWGVLGYSQWRALPLIQIAELTSVYGVSFLMAFVGAAAAVGLTRQRWLPLGVGVGAVALCAAWGQRRLMQRFPSRPSSVVTIVQGNIANEAKVDQKRARQNIAVFAELTERAVQQRQPALVVWPETVVLLPWSRFPDVQQWLCQSARDWKAGLVTGSVDRDEQKRGYNIAVSLSSRGNVKGIYQKVRLVPFGEYIPLRWFPLRGMLRFLEPEVSAGVSVHPLPTDVGNVGALICFESMFPDLSRQLARSGAEWLVVMTNDDWFSGTSAPDDHAAMSVFRAIETRRWVVRAANTGISLFVDECGRIIATLGWNQRDTLTRRVRHHEAGGGETLYVRYGDWFAWGCVIVCLLTLAVRRRDYLEHLRKGQRPTDSE
ncbi:MAG: apolipoprotein N-acyltransferase [Abditibacteriales bacterium]|nr:apolipoprotein N-acyltransferase [Abditibacteriales bacterium]MDW8367348.1 apolipoprotein N-acyltransferase [Abditibacteriales bacterium]